MRSKFETLIPFQEPNQLSQSKLAHDPDISKPTRHIRNAQNNLFKSIDKIKSNLGNERWFLWHEHSILALYSSLLPHKCNFKVRVRSLGV